LDAREIDAWQAAEPAPAAKTAIVSLGNARLRRQRSAKVSISGRSMTFGP
jgi:hypothetical protein